MIQLSVWAQDLIGHLTRHMDNEREALRAYGELAAGADDRVGVLIRQILDDEVRHHVQFAELRDALRAEVERRPSPNGGPRATADARVLLDKTEELLRLEKHDLKELKRLAKVLREVEDTAWRAVIIESMELDTRKHVRLLEGVRDLLRQAV